MRKHSPLKPKSDRARRDADAALDAATAIADEQTKAAIDRFYTIVRIWKDYDRTVEQCMRAGTLSPDASEAGSIAGRYLAPEVAEALTALDRLQAGMMTRKAPPKALDNRALRAPCASPHPALRHLSRQKSR